MALGIALGTPLGVALSLLLDNWGMLGFGIALGVAFGANPLQTGPIRTETLPTRTTKAVVIGRDGTSRVCRET